MKDVRRHNRRGKAVARLLAAVMLCATVLAVGFGPGERVLAKENVVIVIDPGHGADALGGHIDEFMEKEMNLKVAMAMKEELEKYQGVQVYLTRTTNDENPDLNQRADLGAEVGADFFISIHFNMSEYRTLYGTECWVSAFGEYYAQGYDFAKIINASLSDLGLVNRGIKTRIGENGDYYGVIRNSVNHGIPACIIEHCHMDNPNDRPYLDTENWPRIYGQLDATAVAKYFGLKSTELGVDYSGENYRTTIAPEEPMWPDETGPEYVRVEKLEIDKDNQVAHVRLAAIESQSYMLHYAYSLDGGEHFEPLALWPKGKNVAEFDVPLPGKGKQELVLKAVNNYNMETFTQAYDLKTTESFELPDAECLPEMAQKEGEASEATGNMTEIAVNQASNIDAVEAFATIDGNAAVIAAGTKMVIVSLVLIVLALGLFLIATVLMARGRISKLIWLILVLNGIMVTLLFSVIGVSEYKKQKKAKEENLALRQGITWESVELAASRSKEVATVIEQEYMDMNFYAEELSEQQRDAIKGVSYPGDQEAVQLPVEMKDLRYVHVMHYDFDGRVREGELICNQAIAQDLVEIFAELFRNKYPIESIRLVEEYGGEDEASMAANNTSCLNYRMIYGTNTLSPHAYGMAVDINPLYNPSVIGDGADQVILPKEGASYVNRRWDMVYMIDEEDLCYQLFTQHGFGWGGSWSTNKDYQHFEKK